MSRIPGPIINRGDYTLPRYAAESYIGQAYIVVGPRGEEWSAGPADYWQSSDDIHLGAIVKRRHPYFLPTDTVVWAPRTLTLHGTVGDLRRLARAAVGRVRA